MGASLAALSISNLSLVLSNSGRLCTTNIILLVILGICLLLLLLMCIYSVYVYFDVCKPIFDEEKRTKKFLKSQKRAEKKYKEYENTANEILEKLNK